MAPSSAVSQVTSITPSRVAELGIVGAGGGGFPTAVKLATRVPLVIANAAVITAQSAQPGYASNLNAVRNPWFAPNVSGAAILVLR